MGASVGDYNNDGMPDLLVTCFGGVVLYRNNGDGTFTDVTKSAGLSGDTIGPPAERLGTMTGMGGTICLSHIMWIFIWMIWRRLVRAIPASTWGSTCSAGRAASRDLADSLYHNNATELSQTFHKNRRCGDPEHRYGLTAIWSDFDNDGKLDLFGNQ